MLFCFLEAKEGGIGTTHPPLKAPTGFRTGMVVAVASCRRGDEERNVLKEVRRGVDEEDMNG